MPPVFSEHTSEAVSDSLLTVRRYRPRYAGLRRVTPDSAFNIPGEAQVGEPRQGRCTSAESFPLLVAGSRAPAGSLPSLYSRSGQPVPDHSKKSAANSNNRL